ncbi:RNA 2',3'-cyclic phosphodiesterase [Thiomicrorhabdus sp.]|uniref:RNA 2',3'-cyclic phosphodiesterase n=1 Tax=Thiomicrorhabdus sp. TaxID=2039724 RepID=UPI0029C88EB0|nr:RNA 2',3'-cyclic phosphodiesterase [Thiomicrorhabdus sp.]
MRAFIAIPIDRERTWMLEAVLKRLQQQKWSDQVRWFLPKNFHITLHFLGANVPKSKITQVMNMMDSHLATEVSGFGIELDQVELFPSQQAPHTLIVSVRNNAGLQRLFESVESQLYSLGLEGKKRKFRPHISLGRIQTGAAAPDIRIPQNLAAVKLSLSVEKIVLFESELTRGAPIYTPLKVVTLPSQTSHI